MLFLHPVDKCGFTRIVRIDYCVIAGLIQGYRIGRGEDTQVGHLRLMGIAVAVTVNTEAIGNGDIQHILRSHITDDRFAGVGHGFEKIILFGDFYPQKLRIGCLSRGMDVGLAVGGSDADGNILQRAAEARHGVAFEVREDQHGVVILQTAVHDILRQMKAALHGNGKLTDLIHDLHGRNLLVAALFDGPPMLTNELIVFTALGIRAAIEGGVSPEGAYNLSDYYIQRGEACTSMPEVYNCIGELQKRLIQRVRTCKQNKKYSPPVAACLEYISTHVTERITLDEMARELGYAAYYLSGKVKEETGESVGSIIKRQKIETAKEMLRNPTQGAAEIGEQLAFSSPSFFSATFRKYTGMTPSEYQKSFGADQTER